MTNPRLTTPGFILDSDEATVALGSLLGRRCRGGEILLLRGPLGAGKTTLVRGLGIGLDVERGVRSPTFQLIRCLTGRLTLYHADLYRLGGGPDEAAQLGLEELPDPAGVLAVEWPEKARFVGPRLEIRLELIHGEPERRRVAFRHLEGGLPHLTTPPLNVSGSAGPPGESR